MALLHPFPHFSSADFSWHAPSRTFSAFASDFGRSTEFNLGRVYDDACDEGFTLISKRTGREVIFAISETQRDRDGDIHAWIFTPARPQKDAPNCKVIIFND